MASVSLREVTADNWEAVAELELADDQEDLVASNLWSLAESKFDPDARPRAIYAGRRLVGFLMYEIRRRGRRGREAWIYRFMIDRRQQGRGYGRAAVDAAIAEIRQDPEINRISLGYMPENHAARRLYASLGFVETGRDADGEVIAELTF